MAVRRGALQAGVALAALALIHLPAGAQTTIVPDTAASATTATTATPAGNTTIIDGGRRVGDNLFHSFTTFSLGAGDVASWERGAGDGATIANVINRVTGGAASMIDGRIETVGLERANFYFINPAGIVFGANASVAVPNAAYFSTANALRFADGGVFGVSTPTGSVFSVAAPSAFGFIGTQGDIAVTGVGAGFTTTDAKLSLSAANIAITGVTITPGALDLVALGNAAASVAVDQPIAVRFRTGTINIDDSLVSVQPSAVQTGLIRAAAGTLALTSSIFASDSNDRPAAGVRLLVGDLRLRSSPTAAQQTYLGSFAPDVGNAGIVDIDALRLVASETSQISSQALPGADGNAGNIRIRAGALTVESGASIVSSAYGTSQSGAIDITADSLTTRTGALIETTTFGTGDGGDLTIRANTLTMSDSVIAAEAELFASGDAGTITIAATNLSLDAGARISSSNAGAGLGGLIDVTADTVTLRNGSRIEADAVGAASGGAGAVGVTARNLQIASMSEISSVTQGSGDAGAIAVDAGTLTIDGGLINSASQGGAGDAGLVVVTANTIDIRNAGEITTSTQGAGAAGFIQIDARAIDLSTNGRIASETLGSGIAGNIVIGPNGTTAPNVTINSGAQISSSQRGAAASGDAGTVSITADRLFLGPSAAPGIRTDAATVGNAGAIAITARTVELNGAEITSSNGPTRGFSGSIDLTADTLLLRGGATIDTTSANRDAAGAITLTVGTLTATGSAIRSANLAAAGGPAGSILVDAGRIELLDGGSISTNSVAGAAGDITLLLPRTGTLLLRGAARSGVITTSSGPGTGGIITIASPYLILSDGGQILALGQAFGADVLLQSDFYIRSSDRLNLLSVNGLLLVDSQVGDLSTGAEQVDLSFLDASSVLRGQCAATRRGGVNQLNLRATGPYAGQAAPIDDNGLTASVQDIAGWGACRR